ncbi:MAG: aldo/keto reductase [Armatimonadota bacterium]
MQRIILGQSGLDVPIFVVGTAPLARVDADHAVEVLRRGYELGATWWDTSDDYGSMPLLTRAMVNLPREQLTISSKTSAHNHGEGTGSVRQTLFSLNTDYLDIMFLHYVRSTDDFRARQGCLDALVDAKEKGTIRAIGLSSHLAAPIRLAAEQPAIDVVMAPWNMRGEMPDGGSFFEMEEAIRACYEAGKGVILMKLLAAGALYMICDAAIRSGADYPAKHAVVIGVQSVREMETDIRLTLGEPVDASILSRLKANAAWGKAA